MFAGVLFAVPGIAAAEDLAAGDASFHRRCQACHAVGVGAKNQVGSGVQNSPAGKSADFVWDLTSFAAFIANPRGKIPGNKMVFVGIKDETEIADPWAYLSHFNVDGSSKC
jgi:cytochrome c